MTAKRKIEPLAHWAVIHDEREALVPIASGQNCKTCINDTGFTPLEIAQFLGRKRCEEIIDEPPRHDLWIQRKGESSPHPISQDSFKHEFSVEYVRHLRFRSYQSLIEIQKQCPHLFLNFYFGKQFKQAAVEHAAQLSAGTVAKTSIRWIDEAWGYGLFAEEDLEPGDWVGEYTGLVRQLYRTHQDQNSYCLHYPTRFWSLNFFVVDAFPGGNEMRFVNHSDTPNLKPEYLLDRNILHFVLFANQRIHKGDQLTFNYGKDFWTNRKKIE